MAYKYISDISKNDINMATVIPCVNGDGKQCIIIRNKGNKIISDEYETDNLVIKLNKVLLLDEEEYYVHLIECKLPINDEFDIVYNYVFENINRPIGDEELFSIVRTLEDYFKTTPDKDVDNLRIGVFGELLTIKKLYENGYRDILNKYHKNFYSKHDVEITNNTRLEIKTTTNEKRCHEFKHNQIYREDLHVYVASSIIEVAQEGLSLLTLFNQIIGLYNNPIVTFELNKLKKRCKVNDTDQGIVVSENKAMTDLLFYKAEDLPRFECLAPNGVTNVRYEVDCSLAKDISIDNFIQLLKEAN